MAVEMHAGLASDGGSKLKMLLTFIDNLPNGNEIGTYYALDLGGTNFRVLRVQLGGEGSMILSRQVECQPIPQELMSCTSEGLFHFIAATLKQFVEQQEDDDSEKKPDEKKVIGFTFSFPVRQMSVSSGILIKWTKGFSVEDAVGKDVAWCLEEAMTKAGLNMRVAALVNDTVGTLALSHYYDEDTVAAVIFGTGTNACYVERTDAIIKCQGLLTNSGGMVVNMEWGNFWSSHLPRTSYDIALDEESPNYKWTAIILFFGLETAVQVYNLDATTMFPYLQSLSSPTPSWSALQVTPLMAAMHEDDSPDLREVGRILTENLQMPDVSLKARRLVVRVCDVVTRRAARLAAAGIVGILKKIGRDGSGGVASGRTRGRPRRTVVAIEGGLYANYSMFREYLNEAVAEILGEEVAQNVVIRKPVKKGSYPLRPGVQGFFLTCDGGRERQATNEALNLLETFYEELVNGKHSGAKCRTVPTKPLNKKIKFKDSDSSSDGDEAAPHEEESDTEKKAAESEDAPSKEQQEDVAPCKEGLDAEKHVEENEELPSKKQRLQTETSKRDHTESDEVNDKPIDELIEDELQELGDRNKISALVVHVLVQRMVSKAMHYYGTFAVLYEARANTGIERMAIINAVAKSVPQPHKVDLNNPDKTIIVQIVKKFPFLSPIRWNYNIVFSHPNAPKDSPMDQIGKQTGFEMVKTTEISNMLEARQNDTDNPLAYWRSIKES
ncbi:putative Hexokinase-3 [Cocos nucifera]|uniref:hexokinase n=1 Tax=Cocos nucifera TaxID=13894 RepID=A0A8K0NDM2_COCNU|nr:putative Hexokinase-3 [Cocos nucifera]